MVADNTLDVGVLVRIRIEQQNINYSSIRSVLYTVETVIGHMWVQSPPRVQYVIINCLVRIVDNYNRLLIYRESFEGSNPSPDANGNDYLEAA